MTSRIHETSIRSWCVLLAVSACLASGCAQWNLKKPWSTPLFGDGNDKPRTPSRVVAMWVDTVRYTQGQAPTRGFGGRVMFYQTGEEKPVKVDGDLVVYAFDEEDRKPTDPRPTRKYVFPADQLDAYYSESKIGHSYSLFVPWDEVGGYRKEISLIVRFQPKLAPVVISEQTHHILPGKPVPEEMQIARRQAEANGAGQVRAASFDASLTDEERRDPNRPRMQSTTIPLPTSFGRQTPQAEVRSRYIRSQIKASAPAEPALPANPDSTQPSTGSQLSKSRPQASPTFRQEGDRALSPPRLAEWQSPGRPTLPKASGSESR